MPPAALGMSSGAHEASNHRPPKGLRFREAVKRCLRLYATFQGRAARSEFWWFTVFVYLAVFAGKLVAGIADAEAGDVLAVLTWLALLLPALAVTVRRLHDVNKRGWWMLIWFVPLVGPLVMLLFMIVDGRPEANRFGPPPT